MDGPESEEQGLDGLRRRLYEPGATPDDLARFEVARAEDAPPAAPEPAAPPSRRTRRWIVAGAVLAAAVVVGGAALALPRGGAPAASPSASAAPVDQAVLADRTVRAGFVAALRSSTPAGILPYLEAHPDARPGALRTLQRAASTEYSGEGTTTVDLSPSGLAELGGHVTVIVVTDRATPVSWRATRVGPGAADTVVAAHDEAVSAGGPLASTSAYGRGAPSELTLHVPGDVRWGLVVVFTN